MFRSRLSSRGLEVECFPTRRFKVLVLNRKHGEEIVIGSDVRVTVLAVHGNRVKLGISAPEKVFIRRAELDRKQTLQCVPLAEVCGDAPPPAMADVGA